ncbi:hypothetical protein AX16_007696 [Volvariella volvacea WC 439]|nr:hypothetical protein AX16_007696 [Volvariella volvacea WC 439]
MLVFGARSAVERVAFSALPRHAVSKVVFGRWVRDMKTRRDQTQGNTPPSTTPLSTCTESSFSSTTVESRPSSTSSGAREQALCTLGTSYSRTRTYGNSHMPLRRRSLHTSSLALASTSAPVRAREAPESSLSAGFFTSPADTTNLNETNINSAERSDPNSSPSKSPWGSQFSFSNAFADTWSLERSPTFSFEDNFAPSSSSSATTTTASPDTAPNCCREVTDHATMNDRFDWRLRALSRMDKSVIERTKFPSRWKPDPNYDNYYHPSEWEYKDASVQYSGKFEPLIKVERAVADEEINMRLSKWPVEKLENEGYCFTNMTAFWLADEQYYGQSVAAFTLGPGIPLRANHRFEKGTQVLVSRGDPLSLNYPPIPGTVVWNNEKEPTRVKVAFLEDIKDLEDGKWRLDLGNSNIVFERMEAAVRALKWEPNGTWFVGSQRKLWGMDSDTEQPSQPCLVGTELRDVLLESFGGKGSALQDSEDASDPAHQGLGHLHTRSPESFNDTDDTNYSIASSSVPNPGLKFDSEGAFKDDMRIQSWARRYMTETPVVAEGDPDVSMLNDSQRRAMAMMIGKRISLIQGPPGTGKTKTIIETVKLLKHHFQVPQPLLVATFTNAAVDNLLEGFANAGLNPLRVSSAGVVKDELAQWTLEHREQEHRLYDKRQRFLKNARHVHEKMRLLIEEIKNLTEKQRDIEKLGKKSMLLERMLMGKRGRYKSLMQEGRMWHSKARRTQQTMWEEITHSADVICTTCVTSANRCLDVIDFPVVFLDEASMSTEPASLIPLMKGSQHVALIGDHKQLPPIIRSSEAQEGGLGVSLFERLIEEGNVPTIMLDTQYRMHPAISDFPSSEFYGRGLRDGTVDANGNAILGFEPPVSRYLQLKDEMDPPRGQYSEVMTEGTITNVSTAGEYANKLKGGRKMKALSSSLPIVFVDHNGPESRKGRSWENTPEANIVISVVEDLLLHNPNLNGSDIGIISPYVSQTAHLRRRLGPDSVHKKRFEQVLGGIRAMQIPDIEIKTVDGFEGREKQVIIFSTVRNNAKGSIGFLDDRRRLNVGLTRAKRGLIVVGSIHTLRGGSQIKTASGVDAKKQKEIQVVEVAGQEDQDNDGDVNHQDIMDADRVTQWISSGINPTTATVIVESTGDSRTAAMVAVPVKGKKPSPTKTAKPKSPGPWGRYVDYLEENQCVVKLQGPVLLQAIYGNWDAARDGKFAGKIQMED